MTTQTFLQTLLTESGLHDLSEHEKSFLQNNSIKEFIFSKLSSKKFRKYKMSDACATRTRYAIDLAVKNNQPLSIVYPQGGYKLWRLPSSPTADWAEFFNISYVLDYISPIAQAYGPGVKITYYLHTLLMEVHDNLTTQEIEAYVDSFQKLLDTFSMHLPDNISLELLRDADLYTREEYFSALEEGKKQAEKAYPELPEHKKESLAKMAELNIKWDGREPWHELSDDKKQEKIKAAAIYEMAAVHNLDRVAEEVKSEKNVLLFTVTTDQFIGIGSTKASVAKYWVGFGVLQKKNDSYLPLILSPSQWEKAKKQSYSTEKIDIIDLPNFNQIYVFDQSPL